MYIFIFSNECLYIYDDDDDNDDDEHDDDEHDDDEHAYIRICK